MRTPVLWGALLSFAAVSWAQKVSDTGRCGAAYGGMVCAGSKYGSCCSQYGWCGRTEKHCSNGCDPAYGTCLPSSGTLKLTLDGTCGGKNEYNCQGSRFGNCCSKYGYCGSSSAYCGAGCNNALGTCDPSSTSVTASPTTSLQVSERGLCGKDTNFTCLGYKNGQCCSKWGFCGTSPLHCGTGCNTARGICGPASSSDGSSTPVSETPSRSSIPSTLETSWSSSTPELEATISPVQSPSTLDATPSASYSSPSISSDLNTPTPSPSSSSITESTPTAASITPEPTSSSSGELTSSSVPVTPSEISSSPAVASSTPESSSSAALISSSSPADTVSNPASVSTTSSASVVSDSSSSSSESASPTPACLVPTNYIQNPGFEDGPHGDTSYGYYTYGPWDIRVIGAWKTSKGVDTGTGTGLWASAARSGGYGFRASSNYQRGYSTILIQQKTTVPGDVTVTVSVWVKFLRPSNIGGYLAFTLYVDDKSVTALQAPAAGGPDSWTKLTSAPMKLADINGNSQHVIRLYVVTNVATPDDNYFAVDDFAVTPVVDQDTTPVCA